MIHDYRYSKHNYTLIIGEKHMMEEVQPFEIPF